MIGTRTLAMLVVALLATPVAAAPPRFQLVEASSQTVIALNRESIRRTDAAVKAWFTTVKRDAKAGVHHSMIQTEFDCRSEEFRIIHIANYASDGSVVDSSRGSSARSPVIPGSLGEAQMNAVCKEPKPDDLVLDGSHSDIVSAMREMREKLAQLPR